MKKTFIISFSFIFLLSILSGCASTRLGGAKEQLKVGMECNYAPFNWTQPYASNSAVHISNDSTGYADGYDVQIAKKIADYLGMELVIVKMEWDGLIPALNSNTIDLIIAGMSPTDERKKAIDFSDYYYESDLVIVIKKDGPYAGATSLADFSGSKITAQLNTTHYDVIDQIPGVNKQEALPDFPSMINALKSGFIDGYISERPGALSAVSAHPDLAFIAFDAGKGFNYNINNSNVSVGMRKNSPLKDKINAALAKISKDERTQMMNDAILNSVVG
ncbi:MAG: transporter substrate-binding domain-containing protein [Oscillospiraceae bacterium]|nr:transporter substrate-binding domain-containing protein [Oscillospiraceae bacterium]